MTDEIEGKEKMEEEEQELDIKPKSSDTCEKCGNKQRKNYDRHVKTCNADRCNYCKEQLEGSKEEHRKHCQALRCSKCQKGPFSQPCAVSKHEEMCSRYKLPLQCRLCQKQFVTNGRYQNHIRTCRGHECKQCGESFLDIRELRSHNKTHAKKRLATIPDQPVEKTRRKAPRQGPRMYHCRYPNCTQPGPYLERDLLIHRLDTHIDPDRQLAFAEPFPWVDEGGFADEGLRRIVMNNRNHIFAPHVHEQSYSKFNFPVQHGDIANGLSHAIDTVRQTMSDTGAVKVTIACGSVLHDNTMFRYRYFTAGDNEPVEPPIQIHRPTDWDELIDRVTSDGCVEDIKRKRPDTKWELRLVTNIEIHVYHLHLVMGDGEVPKHIKVHRCIVSLENNNQTMTPYNDGKCALRALAYHILSQGGKLPQTSINDAVLKMKTDELCTKWGHVGLALVDLVEFEDCFDIDIDVYSLEVDGGVVPISLSDGKRKEKMTLNLWKNHLSYICNRDGYLVKYKCIGCSRHFERLSILKNHRGSCTRSSVLRFKFNHFKPGLTIFQRLELDRIIVPDDLRFYPYFATFDCESLQVFLNFNEDDITKMLREHRPISMSIASNVDGSKEPHCYIDKDPEVLVEERVDHLRNISAAVGDIMMDRFKEYFEQIDERLRECGETDEKPRKRLEKLYGSLTLYCKQLPVLGFNSANFDLPLLREHFLSALGFGKPEDVTEAPRVENPQQVAVDVDEEIDEDEEEDIRLTRDGKFKPYVIKKGNAYITVCTEDLKFLDICQYLAIGTKYNKFLRAYKTKEVKSFLPYEWMSDVSCLDHPSLPPYDAFFSTIHQTNTLEAKDDDKEESEEERRARGLENYKDLQDLWHRKGWTKFSQLLAYYNNLDVGPFVEAVEKMQQFYKDRKIDVFKSAVSAPGVARGMLFDAAKKKGVSFASILPQDDDLYYTLRQNMVGGPSIIFTRRHVKGETKIRDSDNVCVNIIGEDANGLYVHGVDQKQPGGSYVRYFGPNFKGQARLYRKDMFNYIDFMAKALQVTIWHERNHGEVYVVGDKLDGYCPQSGEGFEFNGCYYHGCEDCFPDRTPELDKALKDTRERKERIEKRGVPVFEMRSCDYEKLIANEPMLRDLVDSRIPPFYRKHGKASHNWKDLLVAVENDEIFGMFEVDIEVPQHLHHLFSEMCPFFATVDIPFEDIGQLMQDYARENNISTKPRRLLVGGMRAEKMLVSTPLLKWYLKHKLRVTHVYQFIEFVPENCFSEFVKEVTAARRAGDTDPALKIIGDTFKLHGNAAYGSVIMNREKHTQVQYVEGAGRVHMYVNDPRFKKMSVVKKDLVEISMTKRKVDADLPIHIGFNILQTAKLRMLQFYYDCILRFCDFNSFEMIEMDTDSYYFAIAGEKFIDIVSKERDKFMEQIYELCNDGKYTPVDGRFFPRDCCDPCRSYDARTPGLFKLEAEGIAMVALCSKTYSLKLKGGTKFKFSSKGLNKRALKNPYTTMEEVLKTGVPASGVNRGIRTHNNTVVTYEQTRAAISFYYCKRVVQEDCIHTKPLPTILKLWPDRKVDVVGYKSHPLWPHTPLTNFTVADMTDPTLKDVCIYVSKNNDTEWVLEKALKYLPPYEPKGELIFITNDGFETKSKHENFCFYWTSGMSRRSAPLVPEKKWKGLNMLTKYWMDRLTTSNNVRKALPFRHEIYD